MIQIPRLCGYFSQLNTDYILIKFVKNVHYSIGQDMFDGGLIMRSKLLLKAETKIPGTRFFYKKWTFELPNAYQILNKAFYYRFHDHQVQGHHIQLLFVARWGSWKCYERYLLQNKQF